MPSARQQPRRGRVRSTRQPAMDTSGQTVIPIGRPGFLNQEQILTQMSESKKALDELKEALKTLSDTKAKQASKEEALKKAAESKYTLPVSLETFRSLYTAADSATDKAKILAILDEGLCRPDWAADIQGKPWQPGVWSGVKLASAQNVKWRTVVQVAVGGLVLIAVVDAGCIWFDLPRPLPLWPTATGRSTTVARAR